MQEQTKWQRIEASLSARRAWIEISSVPPLVSVVLVALRKESVDRNIKGASLFCFAV